MSRVIPALVNYLSQIRYSAMVLTLTLVLIILIYIVRYLRKMEPRMGTLEWIQNYDRPKLSLDGKCYPMERHDTIPLILLLVVYAVVAFTNLGSAKAPQSFYTFEGDNDIVVIDLGESHEISQVMYYSGLYPGDYDLCISGNGSNWIRLTDENAQPDEYGQLNDAAMHQSYADLFKWQYAHLSAEELVTARYIRVSARALPLELGELALYDAEGNLIDVSGVDSVLLDEQSTVPESPSWYNSMYFDEIYHGRTAYENLKNIYPYEITHPPLGKLLIALGISIFGMTPFGWRFMGTFFGVLMLLPLYILLKNMFGKSRVAACGTALFAFDFMHYTQTRIATIDSYSVFFVLVSFLFMWRWISKPYADPLRKTWRELALSGLFFGIGCACKWTVMYAGVGLAALWLLRVLMKGSAVDLRKYWSELVGTILVSTVFFVIVPAVIYCLSYIPYGLASGMRLPDMLFDRYYYHIILDNQNYMLSYHSGVDQAHPYSSRWYQWLFDKRPILYYLQYNGTSKSAFGSMNSPLVAWCGLACLITSIPAYYKRRRPQVLLIWAGYLCQFAPWLVISRTTFSYHYFGASLFLCIAMAYVFDELLSRGEKNKWMMYGITAVNTGLFAMFYPVLNGMEVSLEYCLTYLKWFTTWPFG